MDANQLQELAINALLNHWPPHLGVKTEAEKIAYLAERLRESVDVQAHNDELIEENRDLTERVGDLESDVENLEEEIEELKAKVKQ
jgi:predicted nuclease with TOPRIM domain